MPTIDTDEILDQLTGLSHFLGDPNRDLAILGEGNTSARLDEDTFFVKASGQHLGSITAAGFCAVAFSRILPAFEQLDLTDAGVTRVLQESKADGEPHILPSVETFLHAYLLTLPNVDFVGHTHPTAVLSILASKIAREAVSGRLFPHEVVCCGPAPCFVEYVDPGMPLARTLRQRVEEHFEENGEYPKTILMQNHGLIALGKSPKDVQTVTLMYEKTARALIGTYSLGGPNFLTPEHVSRIHTRPDEHYRQRQIAQKL